MTTSNLEFSVRCPASLQVDELETQLIGLGACTGRSKATDFDENLHTGDFTLAIKEDIIPKIVELLRKVKQQGQMSRHEAAEIQDSAINGVHTLPRRFSAMKSPFPLFY